ncbi:MAG: hypothetical protein ACLUHE_11165 [Christensenellales bacterium]
MKSAPPVAESADENAEGWLPKGRRKEKNAAPRPRFCTEFIGFWTMKNALLRICFVKNTKMTRNYCNFVDSPAGQV